MADNDESETLSVEKSDYGSTSEKIQTGKDGAKKLAWRTRYVEPAFFFYMLAIWSYLPLNEEYVFELFQKESNGLLTDDHQPEGCRNNSIETNATLAAQEEEIKEGLSNYTLLFNVFETLPAIVVSLVLCSWGDKHGRKIGLIVPCVGGILKGVLYIVGDMYSLGVDFLMLPNAIEGISGSHMTIAGSAYAYVADVVPQSSITFRFSLLNGLLFAGSAIGNILIGYMIDGLGFMWSFAIMTGWYAIALLYIVILLEESVKIEIDQCPASFLQCIKEVWDVIVNAFKVYTVKRKDENAQKRLILMLSASTIHAILVLGQVELDTLFLIGPPFCFTSISVGYFLAFLSATSFVGPIVGTKLFETIGLTDAYMGLVACVSGAAAFFMQAFSTTSIEIFTVPIINMYSASITPLSRAIMSKDVSDSEQGAIQASVSSMNTLGDFISVTLLIGLFSLTAKYFYGATFVVIGSMCVLCFGFFFSVATVLKPTRIT